MKPSRKATFWVMATFAAAMIPQLLRMPPAVMLMTLLPLFWRLAAELRRWKPLPGLVRHGATILALAAMFFSYGGLAGRRAAVSLLTVMLALKMIESYSIRDARLVVSFSLFLCATQFLFAQGILMPFYGALIVLLALVSFTHLQRNEAWAAQGHPPATRSSLASELGFSLRLLGLAVPVGLAFFLLFPRLSSPLWGIPETTLDSKTGLSETMSPGSIQNLFMDDSAAFRVQFSSPVPPAADMYWRGPVLWEFDGATWKGSFYGKNVAAVTLPAAETAPLRYTVQMEPNERKWLFALDYPAEPPDDTRVTLDFQLIRQDPVLQLLEYSMKSDPRFIDSPELAHTLRMQALNLPPSSSPRTRSMVSRWRSETPDDWQFVNRVLTHFNEQAFHYSLESPLLGEQPIDEFLFETRIGYCEHYASAFTVMMRLAGIPARVVTGYQGGWHNELGGYVLVRQSDAHAWAEVWLPASGWTRVDPTAAVSPRRILDGSLGALSGPRHMLDYSWFRSLRNGIDLVQQRWNDLVIEYGAKRQQKLFSPLGLDRLTPPMLVALLFVVIAAFSAVLLPLVMRIRGPAAKDPLQQIWIMFLKRLAAAGYRAEASSGPWELAEEASRHLPEAAIGIRSIADTYGRCRYSPDPPALRDLKQAVRQFRAKKKRPGVK
ncbi:MAG: DUF3488 and transglutaminase-like domain-containing protein [Xanthomonadales bacterium]|nr:DUF3488 and transglutaminase-like domain-containing protein [Xanthomonadales bacterium]